MLKMVFEKTEWKKKKNVGRTEWAPHKNVKMSVGI